MTDLQPLLKLRAQAECLYDKAQVEAAIDIIAQQITEQLVDADPVVLCAMNGGLVFAGKLLTKLDFPLQQDYVHTSRYGDDTVGGELRWLAEPRLDLAGRTVLIVDDILDQGVTLKGIHQRCQDMGATAVLSAVLVKKNLQSGCCGFRADFVALEAPDRFLIGYGLDHQGYWRNAPGIFALKQSAAT